MVPLTEVNMKNRRILFVIKGGESWIGGLHYIKNLIRTVNDLSPARYGRISIYLLVYSRDQVRLFEDQKDLISEIYVYNELVSSASLLKKVQWKLNILGGRVLNAPLDQLLRDKQIDFAYPALPRKDFNYYRFAEWIPDFQYRYFPEGSNSAEIMGRQQEFSNIVSKSPLIYLSSEHARKDCEELFPGVADKLHVMQFTVNTGTISFKVPLQQLLSKYNIPEKYFIVSNLLAPTKNLLVVIKAVAILRRKGINVPVVVTGDIHDYRNPGFKHNVFQEVSREGVRDQMIFLGLIDRTEQKQLMVNSISIIQPSRFEGWNTLVEEAKSLGKAIILSDIPVHLEQSPSCGVFFHDNDPEDLAVKMEQAFAMPAPVEVREAHETTAYRDQMKRFIDHFLTVSFESEAGETS